MGATEFVEEKHGSSEDHLHVGFFRLFRFANWWELLLIFLAVIFAGISAASMPLILVAYGEVTALFIERSLTRGVVSSTKLLELFGGARIM